MKAEKIKCCKNYNTFPVIFGIFAFIFGFFVILNVFLGPALAQRTKATIVVSAFAPYDFVRGVTQNEAEISMLMRPGMEVHEYEPTPKEIVQLSEAELIVYVGGESEEWIERILEDNGIAEERTLRLMDLVPPILEDEGEEYDEHVWTSPVNAATMVLGVAQRLAEMREEKAEKYLLNANEYVAEIMRVDAEVRKVVSGAERKELVFGDRFPFLYFVREYGLEYVAAFPGCAEQTEVSAAKMAELISKVREEEIPVVLMNELSEGAIARTIAEETGAKVLTLRAAHNVSEEEFAAGMTYVDIMRGNVLVLEEALR